MAISQNQRLRKAAAKAAKRKTVVAERLAKERQALRISKPRHVDLANSPIAECMLTTGIEAVGIGTLVVARKLPLGRYGVAAFLLDLWCIGVKDAFFHVDDSDDFEAMRDQLGVTSEPIEPARARLLLQDAVSFGAANGIPAPIEYDDVARLLGDVEPAGEPFEFGDPGRPHYVVGLDDSPAFIALVTAKLTAKFGPNGFDVTYPLDDGDDDIEFEDETDEPQT
jgi:hypothetical protein